MKVLIVGANGKVARHVVEKLGNDANHTAIAMVRKEEQVKDMEELGADKTVIADLEGDISHAFSEAEAVIFAAGSGPSTGADKTMLIDLWGALKTIDEAQKQGISRYIMLSAMRADEPEAGPEKIRHYLVAKKLADDHVRGSGLDYTVVRPGPLTNDEPTGSVQLEPLLKGTEGAITRADTAEVLVETLERNNTYGKTFDVLNGERAITEAIQKI
ncbi:SDR family oxidoreductase [Salsuginibacillus kocurii]|uniref:SDR family oxidoreductase n=1 Tax=Salsuginibacillus kocurii TaxID=427078 RepID=UPI000380A921|nr:SDR family oxidoreductase [Salsuginibacillus kocurii]